jgi:hypothetical protein
MDWRAHENFDFYFCAKYTHWADVNEAISKMTGLANFSIFLGYKCWQLYQNASCCKSLEAPKREVPDCETEEKVFSMLRQFGSILPPPCILFDVQINWDPTEELVQNVPFRVYAISEGHSGHPSSYPLFWPRGGSLTIGPALWNISNQ